MSLKPRLGSRAVVGSVIRYVLVLVFGIANGNTGKMDTSAKSRLLLGELLVLTLYS